MLNKRNHTQQTLFLLLCFINFIQPLVSPVDNNVLLEKNSLISRNCTELEYLVDSNCEQNFRNLHSMGNMEGMEGMESDEEIKSTDPAIYAHGIIIFVAWGPLFELGTYFPKYFRHVKHYLLIHIFIHLSSYGLTLWTTIPNIIQQAQLGTLFITDPLDQSHYILGIIIIILSTLQIMGGFLVGFKLQSSKSKESYYIVAQGHKLLGILLSIVTKAQLLDGVYMGSNLLIGLMWGWIAFVFAVRILITVIHMKKSKKHKVSVAPVNKILSNNQIEVVNQLNNGATSCVVKSNFPEVKWVLYGNSIVDMSNFLHPGGNFIMEEVWGREISRFLNGSYALETTKLTKHNHSSFAYNMLNSRIIGEYDRKKNILIEKDTNRGDTPEQSVLIAKLEYHPWTLVSVEPISSTISRFTFNSSDFKISNFTKGLESIGRHFEIFSPHYPTHKRLYTTVLCMTTDNINLRKIMIDYYHKIEESSANKDIIMDITQPKENLSLFIKKYDFKNGFTRFLYTINPQNDLRTNFYLKGPLGRGLELFKKPKGKHVILAVGTGILPMLDLLSYMLNAALIKDFKAKGVSDEILKGFNPNQEAYEDAFDSSFHVELYAAFAKKDDFIGLDIVETLAEISGQSSASPKLFNARIRGHSSSHIKALDSKMDYFFIENVVNQDVERVYVCGSPQFNMDVIKSLRKIGLKEEQLMIV